MKIYTNDELVKTIMKQQNTRNGKNLDDVKLEVEESVSYVMSTFIAINDEDPCSVKLDGEFFTDIKIPQLFVKHFLLPASVTFSGSPVQEYDFMDENLFGCVDANKSEDFNLLKLSESFSYIISLFKYGSRNCGEMEVVKRENHSITTYFTAKPTDSKYAIINGKANKAIPDGPLVMLDQDFKLARYSNHNVDSTYVNDVVFNAIVMTLLNGKSGLEVEKTESES